MVRLRLMWRMQIELGQGQTADAPATVNIFLWQQLMIVVSPLLVTALCHSLTICQSLCQCLFPSLSLTFPLSHCSATPNNIVLSHILLSCHSLFDTAFITPSVALLLLPCHSLCCYLCHSLCCYLCHSLCHIALSLPLYCCSFTASVTASVQVASLLELGALASNLPLSAPQPHTSSSSLQLNLEAKIQVPWLVLTTDVDSAALVGALSASVLLPPLPLCFCHFLLGTPLHVQTSCSSLIPIKHTYSSACIGTLCIEDSQSPCVTACLLNNTA